MSSSVALQTVGRVASIASSGAPPSERLSDVVRTLRDVVPYAAAQVGVFVDGHLETVENQGYSEKILGRFMSPDWVEEALCVERTLGQSGLHSVSQGDLPEMNTTITDYLWPAGYNEGMTCLWRDGSGRLHSALNVSCESEAGVDDEGRDVLGVVSATIGRLVDLVSRQSEESIFLVDHLGRLCHQSGMTHIDEEPAADIVARELAKIGTLRPALIGIAGTDSTDLSHLLQIAQVSQYEGIPTKAVVIVQRAPSTDLTAREIEVLRLVASGYSNPRIGEELGITRGTVSSHVEHILIRLNASNRAQAAVIAAQFGLI